MTAPTPTEQATPALSPDEQIVLAHYQAQPAAPESFRNVLARALFMRETRHPEEWDELGDDNGWHEDADYVLRVVRGETDGVWERES